MVRRLGNRGSGFVASTLDSRKDNIFSFREGQANARHLLSAGAQVLYQLDATKLHESKALERALGGALPDVVVFNFPLAALAGPNKKYANTRTLTQTHRHTHTISLSLSLYHFHTHAFTRSLSLHPPSVLISFFPLQVQEHGPP